MGGAGETRPAHPRCEHLAIRYALERVRRGESMPGIFAVEQGAAIGSSIDDLLLVAEVSSEGEFEGQILYLPL